MNFSQPATPLNSQLIGRRSAFEVLVSKRAQLSSCNINDGHFRDATSFLASLSGHTAIDYFSVWKIAPFVLEVFGGPFTSHSRLTNELALCKSSFKLVSRYTMEVTTSPIFFFSFLSFLSSQCSKEINSDIVRLESGLLHIGK